MRKIANTDELRAELQNLLDYAQTYRPSRAVLAHDLASLSKRVASGADRTAPLHEQIAKALGWPLKDVRSMSLHSLRDLVRPVDRALADDISAMIRSGKHI